ncbi:peptidase [Solihabitans fulvus]|uniref:Peptidase n=1 Tax=Solihabitans fulvus TaxID=1892852 RepID=A0A5B2WWP0_9PSEU|nr:peptidase [Solihabitans fulvus]KAA2255488.1 peptidase [Solihabitans fulvus]
MYRVPGSGVAVGSGVGALAMTGADLVWWLAAGLVLLVVGAFLLHAASRRRRAVAAEAHTERR